MQSNQNSAADSATSSGLEKAAPWLPTTKQFLIVLGAYFLLHLLGRTLVSDTVGFDDADQILLGRKLQWGYGPQPPLYTWLFVLLSKIFGPTAFTLTLLRCALLFSVYALTYFNTRLLTRNHACGVAAAVALQFSQSFVWESLRGLTHSIAASAMILAALLAFWRLDPKRWSAYLAFGFFGGLAVLSKYNTALFYAALLLAALTVGGFRARVLNFRMAVALGVSLLVILPHVLWMNGHRELAAASMDRLGITEAWAQAVRTGLVRWCVVAAGHSAVMLLIFAALFWRPIFIARTVRCQGDAEKILLRTFLVLFGMVVLTVLLFKVTGFKDRWLQPMFVSLPVLLVVLLRDQLDRRRLQAILLLGLAAGIVVLLLVPGCLLAAERLHRREKLNAPFRQLAVELEPLLKRVDFTLAEDHWVAGNLLLHLTNSPMTIPRLLPLANHTGQRCLLLWEVKGKAGPPPLKLLAAARTATGKVFLGEPVYVEALLKYNRKDRMRLGVLISE